MSILINDILLDDETIAKITELQAKLKELEGKKDPSQKTPEELKAEEEARLAKAVADAVAAAVNPLKESLETYKAENLAKETITNAKNTFFENKWTTKFKDEADDAWERISELNAASGGKMTSDELVNKAKEYFNKAVQRKGVDATKPFEEGSEHEGEKKDFSSLADRLEGEGKIPAKTN